MSWIWFVIGLFIGNITGILIASLCAIVSSKFSLSQT